MGLLMLNFQWSKLRILFGLGVAKALINKSQNTKNDKNNTCEFHEEPFGFEVVLLNLVNVMANRVPRSLAYLHIAFIE
jgi:hypothetical protein